MLQRHGSELEFRLDAELSSPIFTEVPSANSRDAGRRASLSVLWPHGAKGLNGSSKILRLKNVEVSGKLMPL